MGHHGFAWAVKAALDSGLVTTPHVLVVQHDRAFMRAFDLARALGGSLWVVIRAAKWSGGNGIGPKITALNFDVEVVDITEWPPEPNIFKDLDGDEDGKLSKEEVLAYFKKQGRDELPEGLWEKEDKNEDGVISWEECSGPKGKTAPPLKDEV